MLVVLLHESRVASFHVQFTSKCLITHHMWLRASVCLWTCQSSSGLPVTKSVALAKGVPAAGPNKKEQKDHGRNTGFGPCMAGHETICPLKLPAKNQAMALQLRHGCVYVCVWPVPWRLKRRLAASVKFTTAATMDATLFVVVVVAVAVVVVVAVAVVVVVVVAVVSCWLLKPPFLGPFIPLSRIRIASGHSGDSKAPGASKEDLGWSLQRFWKARNKHHGKPMVNSPLIRPYSLGGGGWHRGGVPLGSHENITSGPLPTEKPTKKKQPAGKSGVQ